MRRNPAGGHLRAMLCLLILLFGFVPVHGLADTHPEVMVRFDGFLQDASGKGIDGVVTLRVVKSGHELAHFPSKNGDFLCFYRQGDPGPYELHFEAPGFEPQTLAWPLANDHIVILQASKAALPKKIRGRGVAK